MRRRGGLRTKIMVRFAAVALGLSVLLGLITYLTVRQVLVDDRERNALDQVVRDARTLTALGTAASANPSELLISLRPPARSTPLLHREGQWFAASLQVRPEDLPEDLTSTVMAGQAARQTIWLRDRPVLIVGVPLPDAGGSYFEVLSLGDISNTLATLSRVLFVSGAITTFAGIVLAGWIARRVLRPLGEVTAVAERIVEGSLDTRLDEVTDPDLVPLTASFNRMADSLQARIDKEARFASDVAHELRTPLTSVVTAIAVLEGRRHELSEAGKEALGLLARDVGRLERTAADLIEIAKVDAGVVRADLEILPVAAVIGSVLNRLRRPEIPVDVDHRAARAMIQVDPRRFERVLSNLIENADTHGGGVTRVVVEGGADSVLIGVEDDGPGVAVEESERIFERFSRGGSARRIDANRGSGLGLSVASENMRVQEGAVWVERSPSGGARFVIELKAEIA